MAKSTVSPTVVSEIQEVITSPEQRAQAAVLIEQGRAQAAIRREQRDHRLAEGTFEVGDSLIVERSAVELPSWSADPSFLTEKLTKVQRDWFFVNGGFTGSRNMPSTVRIVWVGPNYTPRGQMNLGNKTDLIVIYDGGDQPIFADAPAVVAMIQQLGRTTGDFMSNTLAQAVSFEPRALDDHNADGLTFLIPSDKAVTVTDWKGTPHTLAGKRVFTSKPFFEVIVQAAHDGSPISDLIRARFPKLGVKGISSQAVMLWLAGKLIYDRGSRNNPEPRGAAAVAFGRYRMNVRRQLTITPKDATGQLLPSVAERLFFKELDKAGAKIDGCAAYVAYRTDNATWEAAATAASTVAPADALENLVPQGVEFPLE